MSNAHVEGRFTGAALRPLSALQIKQLILLARQAFNALCEQGALGDSAEFDVWRHQQCIQCVERPGLSDCRNEDYLPMRAHFLRLLGRVEEADADLAKSETEGRSYVLAMLARECKAAADVLPLAMDYAAGFLRNKRGVSLDLADDKTIWHAIYTVRRKAEQLRKQKGA